MDQSENVDYLRRQAARSQRLAESTHIEDLRRLLLNVAEEFSARAEAAELVGAAHA